MSDAVERGIDTGMHMPAWTTDYKCMPSAYTSHTAVIVDFLQSYAISVMYPDKIALLAELRQRHLSDSESAK